jgi:polyferredoxin
VAAAASLGSLSGRTGVHSVTVKEQATVPKGRFWDVTKHLRIFSQVVFLGLTVWVMVQMLDGVRGATIEKYCPFGGVETVIPWINKTGTLCSLSTMNLSILAGVLVMTVFFKRVFCSHVCPMGTVLEWTGMLSRRFAIRSWRVPGAVDRVLKALKYPVLVVIVYFTVKVGELVFRDFDPYYVLFTAGEGHGIATFGLWVTLLILIGGVVVPLSFCKYLCPLAASLAPFGRIGLLRVTRDEETCTQCGECDHACEWGINVSKVETVTSAECSNCQDCLRACPESDVLSLRIGRKRA